MIEYGPVLGDFGDGYFTLSCRTQFPAELVLDATPTEPSGKMVTVTSPRAMQHRLKIPIPSGTKSVSYSVRSRVGSHEFHRPPMTVAFPGKEFRFVVLGNLLAHNIQVDRVRLISERIMAAKAAFVVNTGNVSEHGSWHFDWDRRYFNPAGKMVATIPTFITPGSRDFAGIIHEMHVTPAENRYSHNWSKAIGPIRLIGIDGNDNWQAGGENAKWLDKELSAVKEKFVFALNAYPAYSSGRNSKKMYPTIVQGREVIMPLLSKHHVAAMLSGSDPDYERCEPTPDKGVTQIVIGNSGKDSFRFSGPAIGQNPFSKGKGTEWAGAEARSILIFDVKEDAVEMKCVAMSDDPNQKDENEYHVFDRKKFTPRPGK